MLIFKTTVLLVKGLNTLEASGIEGPTESLVVGKVYGAKAVYPYGDELNLTIALGADGSWVVEAPEAAQSGLCLEVDILEEPCKPKHVSLKEDTRFAVFGEDGCVLDSYVTLADIRSALALDVCDLFSSSMRQALVGSDDLVAVDTDCNLKRIDPADVCCTGGALQHPDNAPCSE